MATTAGTKGELEAHMLHSSSRAALFNVLRNDSDSVESMVVASEEMLETAQGEEADTN